MPNPVHERPGKVRVSAGAQPVHQRLSRVGVIGQVHLIAAEQPAFASSDQYEIFAKYEYPTTTVTLVSFASGKVGKVASVIDCFQPYYFHTHLVGSEGSLLDNKIYSNKLHLRDKVWAELPMALADSGDVMDHPYQDQFQAFFDALEKGEDMPFTSLDESMKSFEVIFAADKSAAKGRPVSIAEIRDGG